MNEEAVAGDDRAVDERVSCKGRLGERGSAFLRRGSGLLLTEWGVDGKRDFGPEHVSDITWTHLGVSGSQSPAFILCLLLVIVPSIGASLSGLRTGSIFSHVTLGGQPQAPGDHILDKTSRMVHSKIEIPFYLFRIETAPSA